MLAVGDTINVANPHLPSSSGTGYTVAIPTWTSGDSLIIKVDNISLAAATYTNIAAVETAINNAFGSLGVNATDSGGDITFANVGPGGVVINDTTHLSAGDYTSLVANTTWMAYNNVVYASGAGDVITVGAGINGIAGTYTVSNATPTQDSLTVASATGAGDTVTFQDGFAAYVNDAVWIGANSIVHLTGNTALDSPT